MEMEQHCGAAMHEERIRMQFLSEDGKEKRESRGVGVGCRVMDRGEDGKKRRKGEFLAEDVRGNGRA
jgi:hypothetical protein